eukprot:GHRQ01025838.1.p4 GENE.GHRQ01025838.1~~GHRQ01025838.1.p4  ORF type:complete len:129 (+),score=33.52 GHRQ01025838.1:369-755(+)
MMSGRSSDSRYHAQAGQRGSAPAAAEEPVQGGGSQLRSSKALHGKRLPSGRAAGKPSMTYWSVGKWGMPSNQLSSVGRQSGSLQEPSAEVLDGLNDLEQRMRATLGALASFNEDERMLLLRWGSWAVA